MNNKNPSVLEYYRERDFNPVPIPVETKTKWEIQRRKRINLLQNHLNIPVNLLKNKHIIEFGCNSGENALVLADLGAYLTLVEPNKKVIPRLESNFKAMNLFNQIHELSVESIDDYRPKKLFDLVIAEGFLNTMPNRDKLLGSLMGMCSNGGQVIINYDDRYGGYFELLKSCILKKICLLNGFDFRGNESLTLAKNLYQKSFAKLNVSRPFDAWWEDQLINPFASCIWSLDEINKIAEKQDFFCYSNSPVLINPNLFQWYKNVDVDVSINSKIMNSWLDSFAYILSGKNDLWKSYVPAKKTLVQAIFDHTQSMADYIADDNAKELNINFPNEMKDFFDSQTSQYFHTLVAELENFYTIFNNGSSQQIIKQYSSSKVLQETWGTMLHYACLIKQ